jgi:hypothetical protein
MNEILEHRSAGKEVVPRDSGFPAAAIARTCGAVVSLPTVPGQRSASWSEPTVEEDLGRSSFRTVFVRSLPRWQSSPPTVATDRNARVGER